MRVCKQIIMQFNNHLYNTVLCVSRYIGEIITDQKANDLNEDSYLFNLENPVS